jgi:hypothetical protein
VDLLTRDVDAQLWSRLADLKTQHRYAPQTLVAPGMGLADEILPDVRQATDRKPSLVLRFVMPAESRSDLAAPSFPWFGGVWRPDGSAIATHDLPPTVSWDPGWGDRLDRIWNTADRSARLAATAGDDGAILVVGTPLADVLQAARQTVMFEAATLVAVLLPTLAIAWLLLSRLLTPLGGITETARRIRAGPRSGGGLVDLGEELDGQRHALDDAVDHDALADEPLEATDDHRLGPHSDTLDRDYEPVTGPDGLAEPHLLEAAEADHLGVEQVTPLRVVAGELGSRLAHQHARHQWHAGEVPADPELVRRDVLVAHAKTAGLILVHDRRQLLHLEPLPVPAADLMDVSDDRVEVVFARMDDVIARGHGMSSGGAVLTAGSGADVLALGLAGLAVGRPGAVIRLLEAAMGFGHGKSPGKRSRGEVESSEGCTTGRPAVPPQADVSGRR